MQGKLGHSPSKRVPRLGKISQDVNARAIHAKPSPGVAKKLSQLPGPKYWKPNCCLPPPPAPHTVWVYGRPVVLLAARGRISRAAVAVPLARGLVPHACCPLAARRRAAGGAVCVVDARPHARPPVSASLS